MAGYEAQDVATFCAWGVDYLKLDARGSTRERWQKVRAAMNDCPRPMYLQVAFCKSVRSCEKDGQNWIQAIANAWRTGQDGQANWASVMKSIDHTEPLWPLAGPTGPIGAHWNDGAKPGYPHTASPPQSHINKCDAATAIARNLQNACLSRFFQPGCSPIAFV